MCDTMAIIQSDGVLFAKNSDRDANEGQNIEWHPRRQGGRGATVRCTWIEIPDVEKTYATLLSRPFWIWGAEIGTNEHGVTIGNESVFTKDTNEKKPGLIGMDLLRLALERAESAKNACGTITGLLEQYGQGGGCGHENKKFAYHNSFIVADPTTAFVLETAGRRWALEEIRGARSISNGLTIPGFREQHSDFIKTTFSASRIRRDRTQSLCEDAATTATAADLMAVLQDHGVGHENPAYALINGGLNGPCAHGGGLFASSQTTGSWVAELRPGGCLHWVTATAAPCTGLFKPVRIEEALDLGPPAADKANDSHWWRHERFHRLVARNPAKVRPLFATERGEIQERWIAAPPDGQTAFSETSALLNNWTDAAAELSVPDIRPLWTRRYWAKRNRWAGL